MFSSAAAPDASRAAVVGLRQGRLIALTLLGVAVAVLWLAVPRLVAGVISAPHGPTVARLDKSPAPAAGTQQRAVAAYERALAWRDGASFHAGLGALAYARSLAAYAADDASAAREFMLRGVAQHRAALALSPLQPFVWTRLVQGDLGSGAPIADTVRHLRMAIATAPWEPALVTPRLGLAFMLWDGLDDVTRRRLDGQIRHAARLYPTALARQSRQHRAQNQILQALADQPDLLRRFSLAYSRL